MPTAALALALSACNLARPPAGDQECPNYETAIRPALQTACGSCHQGDAAPNGYVIGEYLQTVSRREDGKARVLPGAADSLLLQAARGEFAPHAAVDETTLAALTDWNVRCRAAPHAITYHPKGWVTPTDLEQNHSRTLRAAGYDLDAGTELKTCRECHGEDLRGGKSGLSCEKCHTLKNLPGSAQTELECNTCHGDAASFAPPKALSGAWGTSQVGVGAHRTHVGGGALKKSFDCEVCHVKPEHNADEGHYRVNGVFQTGPADVRLKYSNDAGPSQWSHAEATCTNTACHAPSVADTAALTHQPKWTDVGSGQAKCGGCHGLPPSSHADNRCELCHGPGYSLDSVDPVKHLNQVVDLRGDGSDCAACHAGPMSASFVDLRGQTDAGIVTVGAHDAHLHASTFRGPLACADCHLVPGALHSTGHIDSAGPAEVFAPGSSTVAFSDRAQPAFTESAATCGSVYCHGAGTAWAKDTSTGLVPVLSWTGQTAGQVVCGACHGLPPKDGTVAHTNRTMADCATCHGLTITDGGVLKFTVDPVTGARSSTHIDGHVTGSQ